MKKLSRYTIFHNQNGKFYIFHQLSKALLEIDDDLYDVLSNKNLLELPENIQAHLDQNGFIVDDNTDESYKLHYANLVNRYNSSMLRLTVLPTINCNFRCWYCYEQHKASSMKEEQIKSVLNFAKKRNKDETY